jgi:hypothetical protein
MYNYKPSGLLIRPIVCLLNTWDPRWFEETRRVRSEKIGALFLYV